MKALLFILASVISLVSNLVGLVMMSSPESNIIFNDTTLLAGTPFKDFFIPGTLLIVFVGLPNLLVIYYFFQRKEIGYNWAIAGGIFSLLFLVVQWIMSVPFHWVEVILLGASFMMILIAYQLKGKWAV